MSNIDIEIKFNSKSSGKGVADAHLLFKLWRKSSKHMEDLPFLLYKGEMR